MKLLDRFLRLMALASGVTLVGLMLLTVADVVMRYFFNAPFRGSLEMTEFAMAIIVFLGLAYCGWTGAHIAVDLLDGPLSRSALRFVPALMALLGALLFAVIAWRTTVETIDGWSQASNMLRWPHYPFRLTAAFGSAVFALVLFVQAGRALRGTPATREPH